MDLARRKQLYNACKPEESLAPDDPRNVELDLFGGPGHRPRGVVWAERLAREVRLSDGPVFLLFTGLPGSGKTTELRRLMSLLERDGDTRMLPVRLDAEQVIDLSNAIDIPDLLAPLVHEVERAVLGLEGKDPDDAGTEGYLERLWHWLRKTEVDLGRTDLAVPGAKALVAELRTRPSFRQQVRQVVATHLNEFLAEARAQLDTLRERARALGWSDIVVVYDSLEKLRGMSSNWDEVLRSAERVFGGGAPHLQMPVHTLFTVPVALAVRRNVRVTLMPAVKVRDRSGRDSEPGVEALRQLVAQRIPEAELLEVFGPEAPARIDELIRRSGGYLRELVEMLRNAVLGDLPISEHDFKRLINDIGDRYHRIIIGSDHAWLARVALDRYLSVGTLEQRSAADRLLLDNAVVRYENDESWFDLHPAVRELPGVDVEIERLRRVRWGARQEALFPGEDHE
jgi:hypothetical protein